MFIVLVYLFLIFFHHIYTLYQ